jgi:cellulose synthase/poly-beta-1,6-N-acetylglucosamine synthase-like glycosyltransferase
MPGVALALFIAFGFIIAYVYVLYPLLLILIGSLRRRPAPDPMSDEQLPTVSFLIPAYNEEKVIARKIENTLALDYPRDKLEITVASDRSTDATDSIIQRYIDQGIRFVRNETQKGKIATLSELGAQAKTDVILVTDANAIFEPDSLRNLVAYFGDSDVGMVTGNATLERAETMVGEGEGTYQSYENMLKRAECDVFSSAFANGAMSAIRRDLFLALPDYLEFDHVLPMHVVNQGCRVAYAEHARFYEETASHTSAEYKVRVRNATRGFTMVMLMGRYLDVLQHPWFTLHLYSRKVLRWLVGVPAVGLFTANLALLHLPLFQLTFAAQIGFYTAALAGYLADRRGIKQGFLALPFYFCLVNYASLVGFSRALRGQRIAVWSTGR